MTAPLFGAHLSTAGGLLNLLKKARALKCTSVQIFAGNPRSWESPEIGEAEGAAFRQAASKQGLAHLVIHSIYLVNLASPKPEVQERSKVSLRRDIVAARRLGAQSIVLHPGSDLGDGMGEQRLQQALTELLPELPAGCRLLLEGMAGQRNSLGELAVLGRLCRMLGDTLGVCLDTAHLCGYGYQLADAADFDRLLREIKNHLGFKRIGCLHLNDSKAACGSKRDHHENLGEGHVGRQGFIHMLGHPPFRALPLIIETPGFDQMGPDERNLKRLRLYYRQAGKG